MINWAAPDNMNGVKLAKLTKEMEDFAPEYDAIINLVGVGQIPEKTTISDHNVFDNYSKIQGAEINSNLILTHMATKMLTPNGYIAFPGCYNTFKGENELLKQESQMDNIA